MFHDEPPPEDDPEEPPEEYYGEPPPEDGPEEPPEEYYGEPPPEYNPDEPPPDHWPNIDEDAAYEAWVAEQELPEPPDTYGSQQFDVDAAYDQYMEAQADALIDSIRGIEEIRPTLTLDDIQNPVYYSKIEAVNNSIEETIEVIKSEIESHFDEATWKMLEDTTKLSEFISAYTVSARYLEGRRLYVRHDVVHALSVTRYALQLVDLLFSNPTSRDLFSFSNDINQAKIVVALATLWHDCGNAINRIGHQTKSVNYAQPHIASQLRTIDLIDDTTLFPEILKAIEFHTKDSGNCENMESAIVRLADGLDCTKLRCGDSGLQPLVDLFEKGQLKHIIGKAGIDAVELQMRPNSDLIQIIFVIDPDFIPATGFFVSSCVTEIERISVNKISSMGPPFRNYFSLYYRVSKTEEIHNLQS